MVVPLGSQMKHRATPNAMQPFINWASADLGISPLEVENELGIYFGASWSAHRYFCTPDNALVIGGHSGDGFHVSAIADGERDIIVATLPSDAFNVVVGDSFTEFLRLGFYRQLGWLEYLVDGLSTAA